MIRPLDLRAIFTEPSWWGSARSDAPGYRPVTTLTFAWNRRLTGASPRGFHLVNLLLHVFVSGLLFHLARRLGLPFAPAAFAAILFCVLPVHSEPVCWIVGRAELLAAAGFLAALLALDRWTRADGGPGVLVAAAAAFLAGAAAKENALLLVPLAPFLVLLPSRSKRRAVAATATLALVALAYAAWRQRVLPLVPDRAGDLLDNPLAVLSQPHRVLGALSVFGRYLAISAWPSKLSIDYSYDALGIGPGFPGDAFTAVGAASASVLAWLAWKYRHSRPRVPFAVLQLAFCYSIVSNAVLPIGTIMGERLFYLPSAGLCLLAAEALLTAAGRRRILTAVVAAAVVASYTAVDRARAREWIDAETIYAAAVRAYPRSARAHMELGRAPGARG